MERLVHHPGPFWLKRNAACFAKVRKTTTHGLDATLLPSNYQLASWFLSRKPVGATGFGCRKIGQIEH
jgi:hypothetical protein